MLNNEYKTGDLLKDRQNGKMSIILSLNDELYPFVLYNCITKSISGYSYKEIKSYFIKVV